MRKSEAAHREERRARNRQYYQQNEELRARRNEYKRAYRQAHRDQVRKEKYRAAVRDGMATLTPLASAVIGELSRIEE